MLRRRHDDRSSLEAITEQGLRRRRPRFALEGQSPRCPICDKVMVIYLAARGPKYLCGCKENGTNGNGA
jgi:hypothetical protein